MNRRSVDGRWWCLLGLAVYLGWVFAGGAPADYRARWQQLGIDARPVTFVDLYVFPAARAELAAGGDPAVANPTDPLARPYNYPRAWLAFMRFPADAGSIAVIGGGMAAAAVAATLAFWGRLTWGQGLLGGFLLCSPAVMLGVERGNTDQMVFLLVAGGVLLGWEKGKGRRLATTALWLGAAGLKLYPAVLFLAWWRRPWPLALRRLIVPGLLLGLYLLLFRQEVRAALQATGSGWVFSYGATVPAKALGQALGYYHGINLDIVALGRGFTALALAGGVVAVWQGWRLAARARPSAAICAVHWRGFQAAGLIYLATFVVGDNFDYRQIFLLLALPALWILARGTGPVATLARVGVGTLALSVGINYFNARWPGFVVNELAGWSLGYVLAVLLAADFFAAVAAEAPEPGA